MPCNNAIRGKTVEREVVKKFLENGIQAKRSWGSNGEALGMHRTVDVIADINGWVKFQVKRKKELPEWLGFTSHVDGVIVREDGRGAKHHVLMTLDFFIHLLKEKGNE
jgi:Holliday junction resolvase